jgi:Tol biopolymer transport system component
MVLSVSSDGVYLVDSRTGARTVIAADLSNFQGGYASWSPDHRQVAFGDGGIVVFEPGTNRLRHLVPGRSLSMPAWSPDGRTIAYGDGISLWVTDVSRPRPHRLRVPATIAPLEMAWSSTGVIAFEGLRLDCSKLVRCTSTGFSEIWTILRDGTGLTQVTTMGHAEKPKWSPDGLRLLFIRRFPGTHKPGELWMAHSDGSSPRRVMGGGVVTADWSPDGSELAVAAPVEKRTTLQVWVGRADGSHLRPLGTTVEGSDAVLDW